MSLLSATVPSLAKINLDLRVLYKRPEDNYHELRTIFQTISLRDSITIEFNPAATRSRLSIAGNIEIKDNLILRAAEAVMRAGRIRGEVHFSFDKKIPMGGGLGGGSSNAAAVLLALPVLAGRPVPMRKLHETAAGLGSDVPFFLYGGTTLGLGRGTELYPLADVPPVKHAILVAPGIHVSTPEAYKRLARPVGGLAPVRFLNPADWIEQGHNDFEDAVYAAEPELKRIANRLKRLGASVVRMSGSGSSIFAAFSEESAKTEALQQLKGRNVHPVTFITARQYQSLWWNSLKRHTLVKVWPPRSRYEQ